MKNLLMLCALCMTACATDIELGIVDQEVCNGSGSCDDWPDPGLAPSFRAGKELKDTAGEQEGD